MSPRGKGLSAVSPSPFHTWVSMTKNSPTVDFDTTCVQIAQARGFRKMSPTSNGYQHIDGNYQIYVFGTAETPSVQEWRIHKKSGSGPSFPVVGRGNGPADLNNWLQEHFE